MHVDLEYYDNQQGLQPFSLELLNQALDRLVEDARNAYRIYELFAIRTPREVWRYLWVRLLEVPATVWAHYQQTCAALEPYLRHTGRPPWPEKTLPLVIFDEFFCWCGQDTRPEDECWLVARDGADFKAYITGLLNPVRQAQNALRGSDDPLIRHEIRAIQAVDHPYDYRGERPFVAAPDHDGMTTHPQRSPGYYAKLHELLARPEVRSVACAGSQDFQTLRLLCTEQRRRAEALGKRPVEGLPIGLRAYDAPAVTAWQAGVVYYPEELGYGDLWIKQPRPDLNVKELFEAGPPDQRRRWLLSDQDEGEICGYQRSTGEGWAVYEDQAPYRDYDQESQRHYENLIGRYDRLVGRYREKPPSR